MAGPEDHAAAVAFDSAATGSPASFAGPYLAERIERGELYLVEDGGLIVATGEIRVDARAPGNTHLGLIVGVEQRGRGLGGRLMQALTARSLARGMTPRCSTSPENLPARAVIARTGYGGRHRVLRVAISDRTAR